MLGGPLYTVYKTITAIKLAKQLQKAHPSYRFVPVFWLEGEDHDVDEVTKIGLLNAEHKPVSLEYVVKGKAAGKNLGASGEIALDEAMGALLEQIQATLTNSEFKPAILDLIRSTYAAPATLNAAFTAFMNRLFPEDGLVFISANDKRLKQILSSVFQKEILEFPKVSQLIIQRSAELEGRYHAQIKTKAMNLFLYHKGGRYFIEPRENDFSLKGTRHFIQKEELLSIARETPELLSPNVALRPICQDTLLPTVAYVAGPSEIGYFAQLRPVYENFGMRMPVIYPRASATIVDEKSLRIMDKFQLELIEFFDDVARVNKKIVEITSEVNTDEMFREMLQHLTDKLNEMKFGLNYIDPTLLGALENTRTKMESHLAVLKEKVVEAQNRKHETALRQVEKVSHAILPNGNLQERELNIIYFLNRHGLEFVRHLYEVLQIDELKHQVITPQSPARMTAAPAVEAAAMPAPGA
jgi:bacillithiol biosynthesis cysteine-adding enzyme BshC